MVHIGATVVEGDAIRVELRRQNERYERTRAIAEHAALEIAKRGGNIILDSDFSDAKKRASLREKARSGGLALAGHFSLFPPSRGVSNQSNRSFFFTRTRVTISSCLKPHRGTFSCNWE